MSILNQKDELMSENKRAINCKVSNQLMHEGFYFAKILWMQVMEGILSLDKSIERILSSWYGNMTYQKSYNFQIYVRFVSNL